jgi:hypothetical protein
MLSTELRPNKKICVFSHPTDPIFQQPTPAKPEIVVSDSGISFSKFLVSRHLLKLFYEN